AAAPAPRAVHLGQRGGKTRVVARAAHRRDVEEGIPRRSTLEIAECGPEEVKPLREQPGELRRRTGADALRTEESFEQGLRSGEPGLETIDVFRPSQDGKAFGRLPEIVLADPREELLLPLLPGGPSNGGGNVVELAAQKRHF